MSDTGADRKVVLVTGGSGLVGQAVRMVVEREAPADEEWVLAGSTDADLRCVWRPPCAGLPH